MDSLSKVKRLYAPVNYENDDDIILYEGSFDDDVTESIQPTISRIEPLKLKNIPHVTLIKEIDLWILSIQDEVNDSAIAGIIDMATGDYQNYMKEHFKAFSYIESLAIKKISDAQAAVDWVNSKILMASMSEGQKMNTVVKRSSTMPRTDPNEYAYEMDAEEIEREIESAFIVSYDEEKERWFVGLIENMGDKDYPHFMACYLIGMQPEVFQEYLKENFHAETWWESFGAYYITKEQAEAACEWMQAMHVMASIGGTSFE